MRTVRLCLGSILCVGLAILMLQGVYAQNLLFLNTIGTNLCELTSGGEQNIIFSTTNLLLLQGMVFDSAGNLYVSEKDVFDSMASDIVKITPQGAQSIFASGLVTPFQMAFDQSGNLFVGCISSGAPAPLYKISPTGEQSVFFPLSHGVSEPLGMAFDRNADLFVEAAGDIIEFTNNDGTPSTNVTMFVSGLPQPTMLAFDNAGDLFVSVYNNNSPGFINEYTNDNGTLSTNPTVFASGLFEPYGLVFDSQGDLFVRNAYPVGYSTEANIIEFTSAGAQTTVASGVLASVLAFQPVPVLQGVTANSAFQLSVTMPSPYYTAIVQASHDMVDWCSLCTNIPPFTYTDSITASPRFYRAVLDTNYY